MIVGEKFSSIICEIIARLATRRVAGGETTVARMVFVASCDQDSGLAKRTEDKR
jgi:hypothetical protein